METKKLYRERFTKTELIMKKAVWHTLVTCFFQKYIDYDDTVLDIGAGYCEFINSIKCNKKIALDTNPDIKKFAGLDVETVLDDCTTMNKIKSNSIDVIFMSNLLEHLRSIAKVELTLIQCKRVLKPNGKLLILQPNVKYAYKEYWDFFDHVTPLSHKSMIEVLARVGLEPVEIIPRFLPYSTKSRIPKATTFIQLYLKNKWLWRILGKQMFIISKKSEAGK